MSPSQAVDWIDGMGNYAPFLTIAVGMGICLTAVLHAMRVRRLMTQASVYLEIIPPLGAGLAPRATEQFFYVLYGMGRSRVGRSSVYSLEITSSKRQGITYGIRLPVKDAEVLEQTIASLLPAARVRRIGDPLFRGSGGVVRSFRQSRHFAFPIRTFESFDAHDPIAYITGRMNRLEDGEQVALQLVIQPIRVRNMQKIVSRYFEYYKVSEAVHNKGYGRLFRTEMRVRVIAKNRRRAMEKVWGIQSAVTSLSIPRVQDIRMRRAVSFGWVHRLREWAFLMRIPRLFFRGSAVFSSLELAMLYHFPARMAATESMRTSLSRTLPLPLAVRNMVNKDSVLGQTNHREESALIGLSDKEREKHIYIIGGTGNGKTTMLEGMALRDIEVGKGVAVIDPHGDMAEELLRHIPEHRIDDVIYFNPDDIKNPIGLNLLEIPDGLMGDELLRERERIAESIVSILRKLFSDNDTGGSRIESMLRNAIYTAFEAERPTLFTIYDIINDTKFRDKLVKKLSNEHLKKFWTHEFAKAGGMQQVKMASGVTTKIGRFLFSEVARRIMDVDKSTVDFDDIIDNRKILICNFSKGLLGEDTSELFGVVTLAKLQLAALKRARLKKSERTPFYIYVDEFQNFATPSFVQMLAEARKYQMFLTMAEQSTSQQESKMVHTMLANVGTVVTFRTGNPKDEELLLPLFELFLEKGDIAMLPPFHFYARLAAERSQEPVSGMTRLNTRIGNEAASRRAIEASRRRYTNNSSLSSAVVKRQESPQAETHQEGVVSSKDEGGN